MVFRSFRSRSLPLTVTIGMPDGMRPHTITIDVGGKQVLHVVAGDRPKVERWTPPQGQDDTISSINVEVFSHRATYLATVEVRSGIAHVWLEVMERGKHISCPGLFEVTEPAASNNLVVAG